MTTSMEAGYRDMQVSCLVQVGECGSHKVIKARCVETNEGDERAPEIHCRLVAKEVKKRNNTGGERELLRIHSTS